MTRLPRICFIGLYNLPVLAREYNHHGIGGEQVQHTLLAQAFARRGYPVSMVVSDYGQPDGAVWDGIRVWKAYTPDEGLPGVRYFYPRWWKLLAALRRADPDVIYLSCAGGMVGQVALWARRRNVRVVFRLAHDRDCEPDNLLLPQNIYQRDKRLYEFGLRRADTVLAQTEYQRDLLRRNYGVGSVVAGMLVATEPPGRPASERDIDVLWVNNILQFKRPDLLLELARRLPEVGFHMVGGPQPSEMELYGAIRDEARTLGNLTFHGRVPYHDVNDFYGRARVFVNTSDTEGFPNSYLQAWVRGTPVIAFFDPDGVIQREGLGCRPRDLDDMTAAIRSFVASDEVRARASGACLRFMQSRFGEDRILEPYMAAFSSPGGLS